MRKTTCLILALTLTLLCGCGRRSNGDDTQDYGGNTQQTEECHYTHGVRAGAGTV